jgi:hypothetical protein
MSIRPDDCRKRRRPCRAPPKVTVRDLNFYYGEHHALKKINLTLREPRHGVHRPVGLRQVDPAAHLQPHV